MTIMANKILEWLNTTGMEQSLDIQCLFCRKLHIAPSSANKWVTQSFPVLAMLTDGGGKIAIDEKSKTVYPLRIRQPYFLAANLKRQPQAEYPNGFEVLAIGFQVKVLGGVDLLSFFKIPVFFEQAREERLCELMLELYAMESNQGSGWLQRIVSQKRIRDEIIENIVSVASPANGPAFPFMENCHCIPAVKYLNENFAAPLNISKLMKMCCLSRTHFFRLFKKQINITPFEYIKRRRLQEAQNMLLNTTMTIAEIGNQIGWPDQFHFSRIFKKETGISPKQYRSQFSSKIDRV